MVPRCGPGAPGPRRGTRVVRGGRQRPVLDARQCEDHDGLTGTAVGLPLPRLVGGEQLPMAAAHVGGGGARGLSAPRARSSMPPTRMRKLCTPFSQSWRSATVAARPSPSGPTQRGVDRPDAPRAGPGRRADRLPRASGPRVGGHDRGSRTVNTEPAPRVLAAVTEPPCASVSLRTMASPRPLPPSAVPAAR